MFYYRIWDPLIDRKKGTGPEELEEAFLKELRPDGIVNLTEDALAHLDRTSTGESLAVPVKYNKDGSLSKTSRVVSDGDFRAMMDYAGEKVRENHSRILDGEDWPQSLPERAGEQLRLLPVPAYLWIRSKDPGIWLPGTGENEPGRGGGQDAGLSGAGTAEGRKETGRRVTMGVQWTEEQQKVIDLRERNILVSAAAGSGKTAVLVERIISMLTDPEHPLDVDRLLVVTFTEAAAAEMKERIRGAIEERLAKQPESEHLQRQATLIHSAQITTIHSFCLSVIRDHFHAIDLDPGFRIGEEGELKLLQREVLGDLLEAQYEEGGEAFLDLAVLMAQGGMTRSWRI